MGILDSLLGTNTSQNTVQGAMLGNDTLNAGNLASQHALKNTTGQANSALTSNTNQGLGALTSGYGSAIGALGSAGNQAQGLLAQGTQAGVDTTMGSNAAFTPYTTTGGSSSGMLADALGLNGPAGTSAAQSAFQASPGYAYQQDQAANQTSRQAAALGLAGSGSTLQAILNGSSNLANTEYGNWLGNLSNASTQGLYGAQGVSKNAQTAGTLQASGGQSGATLAQQLGQSVGTAYGAEGTGQANLYGQLGQGLSSNLTGLGQNIANTNNQMSMAQASNDLTAGQAQDSAINSSNAATNSLLGKLLGAPISSTSLISPSGGSSVLGSWLGGIGNALGNATIGTSSLGLPNI